MSNQFMELNAMEMVRMQGGTFSTFRSNLMGLWTISTLVSKFMASKGWNYAFLASTLQKYSSAGMIFATATFGSSIVKIALLAGGAVAGVALAYGAVVTLKYLWNNRVFY